MVVPVASETGTYRLGVGDLLVEVSPRHGGRIASLRCGGVEILATRLVHPTNWGSTFWTSPQSDWGWPPPAEFDDVAYAVQLEPGAICLSGPATESLGVSLTKRISVEPARGTLLFEYGVINESRKPKTFSPWEVTRVLSNGLTFFPTGLCAGGSLDVRRIGRATWYEHEPDGLTDAGDKMFADGAGGFIAHIGGRILFAKSFVDLPPEEQAPGEGEVEIYANNHYVEVEVQGPYTRIQPGAAARWRVRWHVCRLPPELTVSIGNLDLLAFATSMVDEQRGFT
ncbi:MAG: hypothetical protein ABSC94_05105 [Polyangiaceae bacterium]|jgi:hypothetical protein